MLWENLPCIYFVLDARGTVFSVNQFGANRLGYSQVELTSQPIFSIFNSECRDYLQVQFFAFAQQINSHSSPTSALREARLTCKDGSILTVKSILHALPPLTGEEIARERALVTGNCQLPLILLICEIISVPITNVETSSEKKICQYTQAISQLASSKTLECHNGSEFLGEITEAAVNTLEVERASVWLYSSDKSQLGCIDLYEESTRQHSTERMLAAVNFPAYFQALNSKSTIAIAQAQTDPRTQELSRSYLAESGITSLLNVPILLAEEMVGILCLEQALTPRYWTPQDEHFAASLAAFVSKSLENYPKERLETDRQILRQKYKNSQLAEEALERERNLFTTGPVTIFRWRPKENWQVEYVSPNVVQFGYEAREFISGKLFYTNIIHQEDLARVVAAFQNYSEAGASSFEQNYRIVKGDGLIRWVYDFTSVTRNSRGEIAYCDGYVLDITESKLAQIALRQQAERERLVGQIQARIRSSLDLNAVLNTAAAEVRQFLETDRVIIFRFRPDWSGDVVVESASKGTMSILNTNLYDPCFGQTYVGQYQKGRIRAIEDIYNAGLSECHVNLLSNCKVRANLVVPIIQSDQTVKNSPSTSSVVNRASQNQNRLWGLLIAHHCNNTRQWQSWETELLKQLATQIAIAIEQSQLYQQLEAANQELQNLASLDGLTKIANRRRFDEVLTQEWQRLIVEPIRLSLILCDIDCFKAYNDTYGHQAGDACLQQVATAIRDACREIPPERLYLVARYGGEEFAVILPNTGIADAIAVAEEIRRRIQTLAIPHQQSFVSEYITLSLGVASADAAQALPETLIAAADKALYEAKSLGRDRVVAKE